MWTDGQAQQSFKILSWNMSSKNKIKIKQINACVSDMNLYLHHSKIPRCCT